jgi:hypothetical protein
VSPERRRPTETIALFAGLVALSVAFRWPALLNAGTVDSDAAIVGLQARHILHGEWAWFLYGSGYQTSVDSMVAAAFFAVLGATSLALMLSTLGGHILATCLAFATLRRHLPERAAWVSVLPLVFTSSPLHTYILNPPRQAALTLVFVAVFLVDRAAGRLHAPARLGMQGVGASVAALACFADPYALLILPPVILLGCLTAFDATPRFSRSSLSKATLTRVGATFAGAVVGIIPFLILLRSPRSVHGEATLTLAVVRHNWGLLTDPCLPWLLGTTAYVPHALLGYSPWVAGSLVRAVQRLGAVAFVAAVTTGGVAFVVARDRVSWGARRLGLFGFVVGVLTVASFLVSVMVMDLFSSRYLAALVLMSPFALAPLASRVGARGLLGLLAPFLVAAGVSGWVGYGDEVNGLSIVALPGHGAQDEEALRGLLESRGVRVAIADYWVSYRLTFLFEEAIAVVPIHAREDRYAAYRDAFHGASRSAYIFDPKRSREDRSAMEHEAFEGASPWGTVVERLSVGALTAVVFEKAIGGPP